MVALGGNALLLRGEAPTAEAQWQHVQQAAAVIAELTARDRIIVTHGNGPQVGLLALQSEAYQAVPPYPLDVLGAQSEGMIGYWLEQALRNALPKQPMVTLLSQVEVDPLDPAFQTPTKFIGPLYDLPQAERLAAERGWAIARDGSHYRRVVPSPKPQKILALPVIRQLVEAEVLVVCLGGGGIPVARVQVEEKLILQGVEAVVDKDLAAAQLAIALGAERLLLLTDIEAVYAHWQQPQAYPIRQATVAALRAEHFAPGSMGPKVEAACQFVEQTRGIAYIGSLAQAAEILQGDAGTHVTLQPAN